MKSIGLFLISFLFLFGCHRPTEGDLLIQNVNVIDVETGEIDSNQDVLIIGDSIASIETHDKFKYVVSETVDGTDRYLIPGLWDMHGHWIDEYEAFFPMLLANGVTGIRDMWGNLPVLRDVRSKINAGSLIGPDIVSAGWIVDGADPIQYGCSVSAMTPEEGRAIVRQQKTEGADFIKVYSKLERDVYFAVADECQKQGIPMVGHIPFKIALEEAVAVGHGSIEHFHGIPAFCHSQYVAYVKYLKGAGPFPDLSDKMQERSKRLGIGALNNELDSLNYNRIPQLVELLANSNSWLTPTVLIEKGWTDRYDPEFDPSVLNRYMPDNVIVDYYVKDTLRTKQDSTTFEWSKKNYQIRMDLIKPLFDGGAKFLAGTDYVVSFAYPGFSLHEELKRYVEDAGITPLQALQSATINPAVFLGKEEELGTVKAGKRASLLLLNGNPLEDIANTENIEGLILRGKYFSHETLNNNLETWLAKNSRPQIRMKMDTLIKQQGIDAAIEAYHKLKENSPDDYYFGQRQLVTLGHYLLEDGSVQEAIKVFELNTKEFPKLSHGFAGLGDAYFKAGENEDARKAWKRSNELGAYTTYTQLAKLEK